MGRFRISSGERLITRPYFRLRHTRATFKAIAMSDCKVILEAIALKRCLDVTYNRMRMTLAPHILYTRHDDLFVDAVTIAREGKTFTEVKLGVFKVAGLTIHAILDRPFKPYDVFNPVDAKYAGVKLLAVEDEPEAS